MFDIPFLPESGVLPVGTPHPITMQTPEVELGATTGADAPPPQPKMNVGQVGDPTLPSGHKYQLDTALIAFGATVVAVGQANDPSLPPGNR